MAPAEQVAHYAVAGNPITHSLSPQIHNSFAAQTGEALSYRAIELPLGGFAPGIRDLQNRGFAGVNVTVPFKGEARNLCDSLSARAERAGAVNTLSFETDGGIAGDNTDGLGLTRDLRDNLGIEIKQREILLLGAGGAVRGVLDPLLALSPARLTIANRTPAKASQLARDFADCGNTEALAFEALDGREFDLVINGTAAGLEHAVPAIPASVMHQQTVCYDMMYNVEGATAFVGWARDRGAARAFDGLGMLVEQAAAAFEIWRGVKPDSATVIQSLRA